MTLLQLVAILWLLALGGLLIRFLYKHTDRYFWQGVGLGIGLLIFVLITAAAAHIAFTGKLT